jgi:hypothetical protein
MTDGVFKDESLSSKNMFQSVYITLTLSDNVAMTCMMNGCFGFAIGLSILRIVYLFFTPNVLCSCLVY